MNYDIDLTSLKNIINKMDNRLKKSPKYILIKGMKNQLYMKMKKKI